MLDLTYNDKIFIDTNYIEFLNILKNFLVDLSHQDAILESQYVIKMMHHGFFSINHSFIASNSYPYIYLPSLISDGVQVICGTACCRHATSFLYDILNLDYDVSLLKIFVDGQGIWHKKSLNGWNHIVAILNFDQEQYLLDPINQFLLKVEDNGDLQHISHSLSVSHLNFRNALVDEIGLVLKKYYSYKQFGIEHVYE